MTAIFLSASVPRPGRGTYHETADPFLIQCAIRELVLLAIRTRQIVWGGHPAITPMVLSICEQMGAEYARSVVLYQSAFFEKHFPRENERFSQVRVVEAVPGDQAASLARMREVMMSHEGIDGAVFVGGMEGVEEEFDLFRQAHPEAPVVAVGAAGGAGLLLAKRLGATDAELEEVDFRRLFASKLNLAPPSRS